MLQIARVQIGGDKILRAEFFNSSKDTIGKQKKEEKEEEKDGPLGNKKSKLLIVKKRKKKCLKGLSKSNPAEWLIIITIFFIKKIRNGQPIIIIVI